MLSCFSKISPPMRSLLLLAIIYIGYISLGLPDTILGVAWSAIHIELNQPVAYAGILTMILTFCSAISGFFSGAILRWLGTGRLLTVCGFVTGISLLGFGLAPAFWCLLLLVIPLGFGQGAIDTGMNYYVAKHYTSRDMNWLHCCWGIGASLGPAIVTMMLSAGTSWRWSYIVIACAQVFLSLMLLSTLPLWNDAAVAKTNGSVEKVAANRKPKRDARFWYCTAMFFLYTGFEAGTGLWAYIFLIKCRGISAEMAGFSVAAYWGMLTTGRFLIGLFANRLGNKRQIFYSMLFALVCGGLMAIPNLPWLTLAAIWLLGFSIAPFYPAMMHATPERVDDLTAATLIGYQGGAAMLGVMVIPPSFGFIASHLSFELLPYLVILLPALIFALQIKVDGFLLKKQ